MNSHISKKISEILKKKFKLKRFFFSKILKINLQFFKFAFEAEM